MKIRNMALAAVAAMAMAQPALAAFSVLNTFSASVGTRAASALFEVDTTGSGGQLRVTLTNTGASDALVPIDILTAVFFNLGQTLTPISAVLGGTSTVLFDSAPAGGVVGGEWAYKTGFPSSGAGSAPGGGNSGISSSGFGLFGSPNFPGLDLDPPGAVDGLQYGITSAGDNSATGNAAVTGGFPLIKNSVVFVLSYAGADIVAADISKVVFQYGTSLSEPNIGCTQNCSPPPNETPEPASLALVGLALLGAGAIRRRRR